MGRGRTPRRVDKFTIGTAPTSDCCAEGATGTGPRSLAVERSVSGHGMSTRRRAEPASAAAASAAAASISEDQSAASVSGVEPAAKRACRPAPDPITWEMVLHALTHDKPKLLSLNLATLQQCVKDKHYTLVRVVLETIAIFAEHSFGKQLKAGGLVDYATLTTRLLDEVEPNLLAPFHRESWRRMQGDLCGAPPPPPNYVHQLQAVLHDIFLVRIHSHPN
jgi:hypothetical protein